MSVSKLQSEEGLSRAKDIQVGVSVKRRVCLEKGLGDLSKAGACV